MNKKIFTFILSIFFLSIFTSCFDEEESNYKKYSDWREENIKYIELAATEKINGQLRYQKIIPEWDKSVYTLMEWIEGRPDVTEGLYPLSNSTLKVKYVLKNINGVTLDSSANFNCQPRNLITGFNIAITRMLPGDSVTAIIPYEAGYGVYSHGSVLPYSTLIFNIKLDSIISYETLPWR